tara:strand:- start:4 stop:159 length:156 start_codon:yes stop_codon:yes gene_type:complete
MVLKLEVSEMSVVYQVMLNQQIVGKDAVMYGKILTKLEKELEKSAPNTLVK